MVKVVFTPSGRRGSFPVNTPLLHAARVLGVDVDSVCGGRGLCGRCQIVCADGSFPKHQIDSASSHLSADLRHRNQIRRAQITPRSMAAVSAATPCYLDDVVIDVPPESQVHQSDRAQRRRVPRYPSRRRRRGSITCRSTKPDMHVPKGDSAAADWTPLSRSGN